MKKLTAVILAVVMSVVCFAGCGNKTEPDNTVSSTPASSEPSETQPESKDFEQLNVACIVFSSGIPVLYAYDMGWFEEAGLDVNLEVFANGAAVNEAIAAKQIDIAVSGFASVYALAASECTWLADVNTTNSIAIYARPDSDIVTASGDALLGSAETVKGKKIITNLGTSSQYNVDTYLSQFGLTESDVEMIHMDYSTGYQSFIAGEGDLIATSNPYSADLDAAGYVNVGTLTATSGISLMDGCFARNAVVENRPEEVTLFLGVLLKAMDALQDEEVRFEYSLDKFAEIGNTYTEEGLRSEFTTTKYVGTEFISREDYVLGGAWVPIAEWLTTEGKISEENLPNIAKSIDGSFLCEASGINFKSYGE